MRYRDTVCVSLYMTALHMELCYMQSSIYIQLKFTLDCQYGLSYKLLTISSHNMCQPALLE